MSVVDTIEGLPVINAKRPIMLHVTSQDIKAARKFSPSNCAVAKACMREWKVKEARVHLSRIYVRCNERNWVRYLTPRPMRSEIIAYDRGGEFLPSVYKVVPVCPSKRTGKKQSHAHDKNAKTPALRKKRKPYTVVKGVRIAAHK